MKRKIKDGILGHLTGDALGVPVEFKSRQWLTSNPVSSMQAYGTYNQPAGTWSDDGSLTLCLADSLVQGYDLQDIARKLVNWREKNLWTAHGEVFDIGITTSHALYNLKEILVSTSADVLGNLEDDTDEGQNGNGSLMRIFPLLYLFKDWAPDQQLRVVREVSALTHRHPRAGLACFVYLKFAALLLAGADKIVAYEQLKNDMEHFFDDHADLAPQQEHFERILQADISTLPETEIHSSGYVMHSLEAAFWCFLNADSYSETVLQAVNLGHDTDTTAAIAGALAGLYYGVSQIPAIWLGQLARIDDIRQLTDRLEKKCR